MTRPQKKSNLPGCALTGIVVAALALCGPWADFGLAQTTSSKSSVPDLSGFWERKDDVGSGSFGGTLERIPHASLKPEIVAANQRDAARQRAGYVVSFSSKWCLTNQYPFFMQHSAAWDIVQTADEVVLVPEVHSFARHIYLDGRPHPDAAHIQPSANGHAVGHWEGDTLVVDSVGFTGSGGTPGGGRTSPKSHLVERFRLTDGGKGLSVTFTWDDPTIFLKPHTYELTYHKSEPGIYAFEEYCHAEDPAQGASVAEPPQR